MNKELQQKLYDAYPNLFRHRTEDLPRHEQHAVARFGVGCGDGWFDIIDWLCAKLEPMILEEPEDYRHRYVILDIKEKFGYMNFYMRDATEQMYLLIREASHESMKTCEKCGAPGIKENNLGWIKTYCRGHHDARKYEYQLAAAMGALRYFANLGEKLVGTAGHQPNLVEIWRTEDDPDRPGQQQRVLVEKVGIDTRQLVSAYETVKSIESINDKEKAFDLMRHLIFAPI
jgi:hypothetical protein